MKRRMSVLAIVIVLCLAAWAGAIEKQPFKFKEDFGIEPLAGCILQYYYYVPCPTFSWFWSFTGWTNGEIIGQFFTVGDLPTGINSACNPGECHDITGFSFIDFAGYGTIYPGLFTVEFEIYCCDEFGCPLGPTRWNSGPFETHFGWNDVFIDTVIITGCSTEPGPSSPRFLIAATHTGTDCEYPAWGFDNIVRPLDEGCPMHDLGCLPAIYPRPVTSYYDLMHSGYYGIDFQYCPPYWFVGADTTAEGTQYGFLELAWKISLECNGPSTQPASWGRLKSMYK